MREQTTNDSCWPIQFWEGTDTMVIDTVQEPLQKKNSWSVHSKQKGMFASSLQTGVTSAVSSLLWSEELYNIQGTRHA